MSQKLEKVGNQNVIYLSENIISSETNTLLEN